jgi:hypothetical protein
MPRGNEVNRQTRAAEESRNQAMRLRLNEQKLPIFRRKPVWPHPLGSITVGKSTDQSTSCQWQPFTNKKARASLNSKSSSTQFTTRDRDQQGREK